MPDDTDGMMFYGTWVFEKKIQRESVLCIMELLAGQNNRRKEFPRRYLIMKRAVGVLVVDHFEKSAKVMIKILKTEAGIQVLDQAKNGYEAITKVLRLLPDIVFMNVNMETSMAAVSACKEICACAPETKVILYGSPETEEIVYKAFQMGAVNFLISDYSPAEVIASILEAVEGKASIHHSAAVRLRGKIQILMGVEDNLTYILNVLIQLTPAELNILKLVYGGMRYQEVAKVLFISTSTMKTHISHILRKFNLENITQVQELLRSTELFSIIMIADHGYE